MKNAEIEKALNRLEIDYKITDTRWSKDVYMFVATNISYRLNNSADSL